MEFEQIELGTITIVERKFPVASVAEATDLVAACIERDTDCLLLESSILPPAFFELRTQFAGEFLQKLQNYRLRTAIVLPAHYDYGERFEEYLVEGRRARFARFFDSRDAALAWLTA